jgi:hypothetical protein
MFLVLPPGFGIMNPSREEPLFALALEKPARYGLPWKNKLDDLAASADDASRQRSKPYEPPKIQLFPLRPAPGM